MAHVAAFEAAAQQARQGQREYGRAHEVPRSTLQYWVERKRNLDASPTLIAFFESAEGLAFLHRLVIAIQFAMTYLSRGLRAVQTVFELAGLEPFVANSFGSRQKLGRSMEEQVQGFAQEQRAALGAQMEPKAITVCEDETFHPAVCLVAIEPVSGFILLESYAQKRDEQTWNAALDKALVGLPVTVCQCTSDEGKGLLAHASKGLKAHHSPDLFHVQHEVCHALCAVLATQVRQAEAAQDKATGALEARRLQEQAWPQQPHGPGRPPNLAGRVAVAQQDAAIAHQEVAAARDRQERARGAVQGLAHAYHPVELHSGALRSAAQVESELQAHFDTLRAVATEAAVPQRCHQGIEKAARVVPAMVATLTFFHSQCQQRIAALALPHHEAFVLTRFLVPAAYLERAAKKAPLAQARYALLEQAERLRGQPDVLATLRALPSSLRGAVDRVVADCADLFQRASSCVEGRNGQLALRHHGLHQITPTRLAALTTVHNYFIQRPDGSTAAQRFFGVAPPSLFEFLLDRLSMPARPAARRSQQPSLTKLN